MLTDAWAPLVGPTANVVGTRPPWRAGCSHPARVRRRSKDRTNVADAKVVGSSHRVRSALFFRVLAPMGPSSSTTSATTPPPTAQPVMVVALNLDYLEIQFEVLDIKRRELVMVPPECLLPPAPPEAARWRGAAARGVLRRARQRRHDVLPCSHAFHRARGNSCPKGEAKTFTVTSGACSRRSRRARGYAPGVEPRRFGLGRAWRGRGPPWGGLRGVLCAVVWRRGSTNVSTYAATVVQP